MLPFRIQKNKQSKLSQGFTLVEVLVATVVVIGVSVASMMAITTFRASDEVTQNKIMAVNLLRKSQEEVRKVAQNNYDEIGDPKCNFNIVNNTSNCSFTDISADFPGFTRKLTVTDYNNTTSTFKRVLVEVEWPELGAPKNQVLQSVLFLAQPPDALPGNLVGKVTAASGPNQGKILNGVQITLTKNLKAHKSSSFTPEVTRPDGSSVNYDFSVISYSPIEYGPYPIEAGIWKLKATLNGYEDYGPVTLPQEIVSNDEIVYDFEMTPLPEDAHIIIRFKHNGQTIYVNNRPRVYLADDGNNKVGYHSRSVFNYTIKFNKTDPQQFTVYSNDLHRTGYVGNFSCWKPPIAYAENGWSSSVVSEPPPTLNCGHPWKGNKGLDRIEVFPGDTYTEDVEVLPVPLANVKGHVRDQYGNPIKGAKLYYRWHHGNSDTFPSGVVATTDSNGFYQINGVPAIQSMYSNDIGNQLRIWATAQVTGVGCCGQTITGTYSSPKTDPDQRVPNVTEGSLVTKDIVIKVNTPTEQCGDAQGIVRVDPLSGFGGVVSSANVNLAGKNRVTNGAGSYEYQCPSGQSGFSIKAGEPVLTASKGGYFGFKSNGNYYYNPPKPFTNVKANQMNTVKEVKLWPIRTGRAEILVVEKDTGLPISGAKINAYYTIGSKWVGTRTSNGSGLGIYDSLWESWPPQEVKNNPSGYNLNWQGHYVWVSHPDAVQSQQKYFSVTKGQTKKVTVTLDLPGGF